jgi:hypothetical protein
MAKQILGPLSTFTVNASDLSQYVTNITIEDYTMVGRPYSWPPVSGGPGDANTIDVTFQNGGTAGLTRGTS